MIGADTNVLVRAALDDDPKEAEIAKNFLLSATKQKSLFISSYAILEMVWVLKVKNRSRSQICEAILNLIDSPGVTVGQRETVVSALEKYSKGKADFGDYLILAEGEEYRTTKLASFDKQLCKDDERCKHPSSCY